MRRSARRTRIGIWLIGAALAGILLTGCYSTPDSGQQEITTVPEPTYVHQLSITETTVGGLGNGWNVGVASISFGEYADAEGKERKGRVARISVWNDALEQSDTLRVYEGMVFPIGEQRGGIAPWVRSKSKGGYHERFGYTLRPIHCSCRLLFREDV